MSEIPSTTTDGLLESIPDLILEVDPQGTYVAFHSGPTHDLYCKPEDFLGQHFAEVLPEEASIRIREGLKRIIASGQATEISYPLAMEGETRYFDCRLLPLKTGNFLALIRDMTESWRSQTELEQNEAQFRALVNNIPGVVYRCHVDADWTSVYISENVEKLLGYPAEDFMSGERVLATCLHPEDRARLAREVDEAVKAKRQFDLTYRMIDSDGNIHHVQERGRPVYAKLDEAHYIDGVIFDVTEIHQMRQRVLINHKMAAVGSLAAGVAHEINNPLAIILANLEYVSEELSAITNAVAADPPVVEALADVGTAITKVQSGTDRVRRIIDDLRTFSDAAESRADQIDLRRLVSWAVQSFDSTSNLSPEVTLKLGTVPEIWASEVGVVQVIWNLLANAFDAISTQNGNGGELGISLSSDDELVILEVTDNGPGMNEEVARRAFEPFFTTKAVGEGAGLGLFVCQGLVEGMDGEIDLLTTPGVGTTVRVSFPTFHRP